MNRRICHASFAIDFALTKSDFVCDSNSNFDSESASVQLKSGIVIDGLLTRHEVLTAVPVREPVPSLPFSRLPFPSPPYPSLTTIPDSCCNFARLLFLCLCCFVCSFGLILSATKSMIIKLKLSGERKWKAMPDKLK